MGAASIVNLGSLNIDRVFQVEHIARPGETIACQSLSEFAGGKGANQSVALARAGARVMHVGKIGVDGRWLLDKLAAEGIDASRVLTSERPTGQAIIQVDAAGENSILLWPGANHEVTPEEVDAALPGVPADAWLLVQNETSAVAHAIKSAHARGMRVAFNPAPFDHRVREYPLGLVHLLIVNETEGAALSGGEGTDQILAALSTSLPRAEIVLTLGAAGAVHIRQGVETRQSARRVVAVDTTAAGDTFAGYFLAHRAAGHGVQESLEIACRAAAQCVTRPGALDSIPRLAELGTPR